MSAWGKGGSARSCDALLNRIENNDPDLVELVILPIKSFGSVEASRLAKGILNNTNLKSISASGHSLDATSFSVIGSAIAQIYNEYKKSSKSRGITEIAIGDRNMSDEGVIALCDPLQTCNGGFLAVVNLELKKIAEEGAGAIGRAFGSSTYLNHLNVSRNPDIGDNGLINLVSSASENAHGLNKEGENERKPIFPSLEYLDLSQCNIGPDGIKAFSNLFLYVGENTYDRSTLVTLKLNENPIGNQGIIPLTRLISSKLLDKNIRSVLVSLSLQQCNIDDEGIETLTAAMAENGSAGLCILDLAKNKIGEKGSHSLSKSFQSGSWKTLNDLNLASNPLGENGVVSICDGVKSLNKVEHLNLCETSCGFNGAIAAISLQNVVSLRLFNNKLRSLGFEKIAPLLAGGHVSLVNLDLGGNSAEEEAVICLFRSISIKNETFERSSLRVLEIGGNEMGEDAEESLKELLKIYPTLDVARDRPKRQN